MRPRSPDRFTPPNGAAGSDTIPRLGYYGGEGLRPAGHGSGRRCRRRRPARTGLLAQRTALLLAVNRTTGATGPKISARMPASDGT